MITTQDALALAGKLEELWRVSTHPDRQSGSHESMAAHYADQELRELGVYPPGKPLVPFVVAALRALAEAAYGEDGMAELVTSARNALALARPLREEG